MARDGSPKAAQAQTLPASNVVVLEEARRRDAKPPFRELRNFLDANSQAREAFRRIAGRLMNVLPPGPAPRVVSLTSAKAGEGTTTSVASLAITLARAGVQVLVVDAALRNPAMHKLLELPRGPGLCQALLGQLGVDEVVRHTKLPGLSLLPAGEGDANFPELFRGAQLEKLVKALRKRTETYILIDSSPLLSAPESTEIARLTDGVAAVIRVGATERQTVQRALEDLAGTNFLGIIVNDVREPGAI